MPAHAAFGGNRGLIVGGSVTSGTYPPTDRVDSLDGSASVKFHQGGSVFSQDHVVNIDSYPVGTTCTHGQETLSPCQVNITGGQAFESAAVACGDQTPAPSVGAFDNAQWLATISSAPVLSPEEEDPKAYE